MSIWSALISFMCLAHNYFHSNAENINLAPRQQIIIEEQFGRRFGGNFNGHNNHFSVLAKENGFAIIGARNAVYNISTETLAIQNIFNWVSSPKDVEMCLMKGKSEEECQNYIRVFARQKDDTFLVCGTNAYNPLCRQYSYDKEARFVNERVQMEKEFHAFAIVPFDPWSNFTWVYVADKNELFAGSVSDFAGTDSLLYRKPLSAHSSEIRTQRNDLKCLSDPNFVFSFEHEDFIYFWFRENALESSGDDKVVYSRVGRVCKRDPGGTRGHKDVWTSFVKARLNCSMNGDIPFYFNEIQSATLVGNLVYGVFSTPRSSLQSSAVCVFDMYEITSIFDRATFKIQSSASSLWLPMSRRSHVYPKPGECLTNARLLNSDVVNFVQKNSLIHEVIPSYFGRPVFINSDSNYQLTKVAVRKEKALNGILYDVIFVGTDDGRVLKLVNPAAFADKTTETVLISVVKVFRDSQPVSDIVVEENKFWVDEEMQEVESGNEEPMLVLSANEALSVSTCHCSQRPSCSSCVRLQDPCCVWDSISKLCVTKPKTSLAYSLFIQNVITGMSHECPTSEYEAEAFAVNELYVQPDSERSVSKFSFYNAESLAIAISLTFAVASIVGFIVGYRLTRWKVYDSVSDDDRKSASSSTQNELYAIHCKAELVKSPLVDVVLTTYDENIIKPVISVKNEISTMEGRKTKKIYL